MRTGLALLSAVLLLGYPLAVYFGTRYLGLTFVGGVLIAALFIRVLTSAQQQHRTLRQIAWLTGILGGGLVILSLVFQQQGWLLYYPVMVNAVMLAVFALSLYQPQTIIESLARLKEPDLPPKGVRYTRRVTQIWCVFFLFNGCMAWLTGRHSLDWWTLYNGLISYLLIGSLLALEWGFRQWFRKQE